MHAQAAATTAAAAAVAQYVVGFGSYLWPTTTLEQRQALGPYHRFWGLAVYGAGMAAAAVSILIQLAHAQFCAHSVRCDGGSGAARLSAAAPRHCRHYLCIGLLTTAP
jgi:hypothetical protein